ncbi:MAG: insulinase family protein, partial [Paracoccaceae bacterium]
MIRAFVTILVTFIASLVQAMPDIKTFTTPAGTPAWLVEDHNIPFVALELRFIGGTAIEPMEKRGVTQFMMGLLEEGSGDMDAQAFSIAKDDLAASFDYGSYADVLTVSAKFLTENQDQAIELLRQSLVDPRFDADAIERVRAQIESGIKSQAKDPSDIASAAFNAEAYPNHPYGS